MFMSNSILQNILTTLNKMPIYHIPLRYIPIGVIKYVNIGLDNDLTS